MTRESFKGFVVETVGGAIVAIHATSNAASTHGANVNKYAPGTIKKQHRWVECKVHTLGRYAPTCPPRAGKQGER